MKRVSGLAIFLPLLLVLQMISSFSRPTNAATSPVTPLPPVGQSDPRFGIVQAVESTDRAVQAGARWERLVFHWSAYQPQGAQDWSTTDPNLPGFVRDDTISSQIAAGITPVGVVLSTPTWAARDSSGSISPPKGLDLPYNDPSNSWGQFMSRLAARYQGRVDQWVIWNEPDQYGDGRQLTWTGSIADYYQLVKVADQAVKAVNPSATVVVAGMTYWWDKEHNRPQYLDSMLDIAAQDPTAPSHGWYFDAVDVHCYGNPLNAYNEPTVYHRILQRHGFDKPVWISEMNVVPNDDPVSPVPNGPFRATMDQQANYMIQASALAIAGNAARISVYKMRDTGGEGAGELYGLIRDDGSVRPAYVSWQFAVRTFQNVQSATYSWSGSSDPPTEAQTQALLNSNIGRVQWIWPGAVNKVVMTRGNQRITVVWNGSPQPVEAAVPVSGNNARLMDKFGNQLATPVTSAGAYRIPLEATSNNTDPRDPTIYLVGGSPYILLEDVNASGAIAVPTPTAMSPTPTPVAPSRTATPTEIGPSTAAAPPRVSTQRNSYFDRTGHNVYGPFLAFYESHGGLDIFGYPRTEVVTERGFQVQYYQRARMEFHPELAGTPYEINLSLFGDQLTAARRPFATVVPFTNSTTRLYLPQTRHSISFGFLHFFKSRGDIDVFGYPISEEMIENGFTVQYFQRARFEYHPEFAGTPYEVELGLLGDQVLQQMGSLR